MLELPEEKDPYRRPTPYAVLGVKPDASATEIRDRHTRLTRDLQESSMSGPERSKRRQVLDEAYDQLRVSGKRIFIDFFLIDDQIGRKQCRTIAESIPKPNTDVGDLIKPRRIKVSHLAVLDVLERLGQDPPKVIGLVPRAIELSQQASIPDPLAIQFDC